jgi:hypothetical protein
MMMVIRVMGDLEEANGIVLLVSSFLVANLKHPAQSSLKTNTHTHTHTHTKKKENK